jgi:hypothetical protein
VYRVPCGLLPVHRRIHILQRLPLGQFYEHNRPELLRCYDAPGLYGCARTVLSLRRRFPDFLHARIL